MPLELKWNLGRHPFHLFEVPTMKSYFALLAAGLLSVSAVGCDVDVVEDGKPDVNVVETPDVDAPDVEVEAPEADAKAPGA
jgi:hypothetical protein